MIASRKVTRKPVYTEVSIKLSDFIKALDLPDTMRGHLLSVHYNLHSREIELTFTGEHDA